MGCNLEEAHFFYTQCDLYLQQSARLGQCVLAVLAALYVIDENRIVFRFLCSGNQPIRRRIKLAARKLN